MHFSHIEVNIFSPIQIISMMTDPFCEDFYSSFFLQSTLPCKEKSYCFLVENLFIKRILCIPCGKYLSTTSKVCLKCINDNPKRLAFIFDSIQEIMFARIYDRLSSIIESYRQSITKQETDYETNDIVYNRNYKLLCDSVCHPFISIIIHLDGIDLTKSTMKLWILSCSIVELPPNIRNRRQNNIILSLWISQEQPNIHLWLDHCFCQLIDLKRKGKSTNKNE